MSKNAEVTRVLTLAMRPKTLSDMVGQQAMSDAIKAQFISGRIPHFYIIGGPVGCGKTSLARILSLHIQTGNGKDLRDLRDLNDEDWRTYKRYDIEEINAANQNGVDYVRQLTESARYKPLPPSKVKVLILDEAHQLSNSAQNCLLTATEDAPAHVFIIFCTSQVSKIIPGLRRRAYILQPKSLDQDGTTQLLEQAKRFVGYQGDISELSKFLSGEAISTPGLIVQAAERYFCGLSVAESINFAEIARFDGLPLCRTLVAGDWLGCAGHLKNVVKSDVAGLKVCALGYLKAVLLKTSGNKAVAISRAIAKISEANIHDETSSLPTFVASVCFACDILTPPRAAKAHVAKAAVPESAL